MGTESVRFRYYAVFGVMVLMLWAAIAYTLSGAQRAAIDKANIEGRNLARSLAEHEAASVRAIDFSLRQFRDAWLRNPRSFGAFLETQRRFLDEQPIGYVGVINAVGFAVYSSSLPNLPRLDLRDRSHFKVPKERGTDELYISEPVFGRGSKQWSIQFARPMYDSEKRFAGVMLISVPPPALEKVYDDIQLGQGGSVTLLRSDGQILARSHNFAQSVGVSLADSPALAPAGAVSGSFRRLAVTDGVDRLYSFHRVPGFPLSVAVGQTVDAVLAPYREQRRTFLFSGAVATALLLALTLLLISRERDQRAAQRNRAQLAAIVEGSDDAIVSTDLDGNIESWNAGAERLYGYKAVEAIGQNVTALIIPTEQIEELRKLREKVAQGESLPPMETERIAKDGRQLIVSFKLSPVKDQHGNVRGLSGSLRDISERRQAEQLRVLEHSISHCLAEAIDAEEALRGVMRIVCQAEGWEIGRYFSLDERADVLHLSEFWTQPLPAFSDFIAESRKLSYAPGMGLAGRVWQSRQPIWVPDITRDARVTPLPSGIKAGMHGAFAFPVTTENYVIGVFTFSSREVREPSKRMLESIGVIGGQIGQYLHRKQLEAQRIQLATIVENSNDAVVGRNSDGGILIWNTAAERLLGWTAAEALGQRLPQLYLADDLHNVVANRERVMRGESVEREGMRVTKDGRRIDVWITASPIKDTRGKVVGASSSLRDITERKRSEERIRMLNQDLERRVIERTAELTAANKALIAEVQERRLAEASALSLAERVKRITRQLGEAQETERHRLAAELHDGVCSNLAAIGLNLAFLKGQLPMSDMAGMERQMSDLIAMIDEAKENAKDISIDLRPLLRDDRDLLSALRDYTQKFRENTGIAVQIRGLSCSRQLPAAEKIALFRIVQEALTNCAKHAQAKAVAVELNTGANESVLTISDDGIGFDVACVSATSRGLGLLSMQERAEAIGGMWRIDSMPGNGTRISIRVGTGASA